MNYASDAEIRSLMNMGDSEDRARFVEKVIRILQKMRPSERPRSGRVLHFSDHLLAEMAKENAALTQEVIAAAVAAANLGKWSNGGGFGNV